MGILDRLKEIVKEFLISAIDESLGGMFDFINEQISQIGDNVGQTPQGWNETIFSLIQSLSDAVIVPIAGMIITFVLCYELISTFTEKNNMHEVDTFLFFKFFFKAWVAVYIVAHTFDIVMAVFDVAQHVISASTGLISGSTDVDASVLDDFTDILEEMNIPKLFLILILTGIIRLVIMAMGVWITIILYGRMMEIYLYCSVAPIPFATMSNREWGSIGNNYLKGLIALGFQGFFIIVCVGIYAALIQAMVVNVNDASEVESAILQLVVFTVLLCVSLSKTSSISKSIFNAH